MSKKDFVEYMGHNDNENLQNTEDNKTLGRARDPRANGAWLNKLTE